MGILLDGAALITAGRRKNRRFGAFRFKVGMLLAACDARCCVLRVCSGTQLYLGG